MTKLDRVPSPPFTVACAAIPLLVNGWLHYAWFRANEQKPAIHTMGIEQMGPVLGMFASTAVIVLWRPFWAPKLFQLQSTFSSGALRAASFLPIWTLLVALSWIPTAAVFGWLWLFVTVFVG